MRGGAGGRAGLGGPCGLQRAHPEATATRQRHLAPHPQSSCPGCGRLPLPHPNQTLHPWHALSPEFPAVGPTPAQLMPIPICSSEKMPFAIRCCSCAPWSHHWRSRQSQTLILRGNITLDKSPFTHVDTPRGPCPGVESKDLLLSHAPCMTPGAVVSGRSRKLGKWCTGMLSARSRPHREPSMQSDA